MLTVHLAIRGHFSAIALTFSSNPNTVCSFLALLGAYTPTLNLITEKKYIIMVTDWLSDKTRRDLHMHSHLNILRGK